MIRVLIFACILGGIAFLWNKTQLPEAPPLSGEELRTVIKAEPDLAHVFERAVAKLNEEKAATGPDSTASAGTGANFTFDEQAISALPNSLAESLRAAPEQTPQLLQKAWEEIDPANRFDRKVILDFARQVRTEARGTLSGLAVRALEVPTSEHLTQPGEEELFRAGCELAQETITDPSRRAALFVQLSTLHPSPAAQEILKAHLGSPE